MSKKTYPPKMTGYELREIRTKVLKMTQTELALALWMSKKSGHRAICAWERGDRGIRSTVQLAIAYLIKHGVLSPP